MENLVIVFLGFIVFCIICVGCINSEKTPEEKTPEEKEMDERRKACEELRYEGRKESEFWSYFVKRKKGKLTYIVPEFEQRIVKMEKLKRKYNVK